MSRCCLRILTLSLLALLTGCNQQNPLELQRQAFEQASRGDQQGLQRALDLLQSIDDERAQQETHELEVICLVRTGQADKALELAKAVREAYPEYSDSFLLNYYIGKIYFDQANYRAAMPYLNEACKLNPNDGNAMLLRALTATHTADSRGSLYFRQLKAMEEFRDNPLVDNEWAMWYLATDQPQEAIAVLVEALRSQQRHPVLALNAAVIFDQHLHLTPPAIRHYELFKEMADDSFRDRHIAVQRRLQQLKDL